MSPNLRNNSSKLKKFLRNWKNASKIRTFFKFQRKFQISFSFKNSLEKSSISNIQKEQISMSRSCTRSMSLPYRQLEHHRVLLLASPKTIMIPSHALSGDGLKIIFNKKVTKSNNCSKKNPNKLRATHLSHLFLKKKSTIL